MKRLLCFFLLVTLVFTACACSSENDTPSRVDTTIHYISLFEGRTVTSDDKSTVHMAQNLYNSLTEQQQQEVHNRKVMFDAIEELERIERVLDNMDTTLSAYCEGYLPQDFADFKKAVDECNTLSETDRSKISSYEKAVSVLDDHDTWYGEDSLYRQINDLYESENYNEVIVMTKKAFGQDIPSAYLPGYSALYISSLEKEAQRLLDARNYQGVLDTYDEETLKMLANESKTKYISILGKSYEALAESLAQKKDITQLTALYQEASSRSVLLQHLAAIGKQVEDIYAKNAERCLARKDYNGAITIFEENKNNPMFTASRLREIAVESYFGLARKDMNAKKYYEAYQTAIKAKNLAASSEQKTQSAQLITEITDKARPNNGAILERSVGSGQNEFTVHSSSSDACIKLESKKNSNQYVLFFVHKNSSATINIADGEYVLKYVTGVDYIDKDNLFLSNKSYSMAEDDMKFDSYSSGGYIYYDTISVTLYTMIGGNMDMESISPDEF